jgi:hypothetical protein
VSGMMTLAHIKNIEKDMNSKKNWEDLPQVPPQLVANLVNEPLLYKKPSMI